MIDAYRKYPALYKRTCGAIFSLKGIVTPKGPCGDPVVKVFRGRRKKR